MRQRLLVLMLLLPMGGCATRGDVQNLRAEMGQMQAAQERLLREIQRQNSAILDSLAIQDVRQRGDFTNQMVQIERQLVQIQELTGQGQQRLAELRQTLNAREEALRRAESALPTMEIGNPDELFDTALSALERGSIATARAGFEEFTRAFPDHPDTPEARLYLGAILTEEGELEGALGEYARILELHPNTPHAATALLRAALIEGERGNRDRARSMLNQLTAAYPGSPEAGEAREELRRLR